MASKDTNDDEAKPVAPDAEAAPSAKAKPARFDVAGAHQAHLRSLSALRGKHAGPMKKGPTRR